MKVKYITMDRRLEAQVEGSSQKEIFKAISDFQEIFEHEACGNCGSVETVFQVRSVDGNDFYQKSCTSCRAALSYGQTKVGDRLFPKRKDKDGNWDNTSRGWYVYQKN